MSESDSVVMSRDAVAQRVREIGAQIRKERGKEEVLLLCMLKGAFVLTADLLRAIDGKVAVEFIDKIQDIADTVVADATEIDFVSHCNLSGRNVYVVKDVVSTGVIENYLLTNLRLKGPKDLKLVAVVDRPDSRTVSLEVDYAVFQGGDGTYVGYGLEGDGRHANLPHLERR
jgi:hypoxanthine phosphoribosyltransferase